MIRNHSLMAITAISFLLSYLLTPLIRDLFLRMGIIDRPDGERKIHTHAVPRVGGISITFSYVAAYGVLLLLPWRADSTVAQELPFIGKLLPAAALIFATGLLDDIFGLRPWQKLAGQIAGASVAIWAGVEIGTLAGHTVPAGWSTLLTIAWLVGCTNAFNLIDGLDGLASGMGLFATLTTFVAAILHGNDTLALATLPLAGCLLGFLRYNFNPASVFLGDSGSLPIGFLLGCYGVIWSQKSATLLGMTAPLMAMAIPLLDTGLAIIRRWLRGAPIFGADRSHIHHKLLDKGLTQRRVVLLLYLACGVYAALSLLQSMTEHNFGGAIVVLFCVVTWLGLQHLGYIEFGVAGRAVFGGALRRIIHGQIALLTRERELSQCRSNDECWRILLALSADFGFSGTRARLNGGDYSRFSGRLTAEDCWQIHVPLPRGDYVHLFRRFDSPVQPGVLMPLVGLLRENLAARLDQWRPETEPAVDSRQTDLASLLGLMKGIEAFQPASREQELGTLSRD